MFRLTTDESTKIQIELHLICLENRTPIARELQFFSVVTQASADPYKPSWIMFPERDTLAQNAFV
jgi:hypothetical protein